MEQPEQSQPDNDVEAVQPDAGDTESAAGANESAGGERRRGRHKELFLAGAAVLPAMFTLCNALLGFAAIHIATRDELGKADLSKWGNIEIAGWMIFLAMIADLLDGRLARWARKTSDFGAQLDSLADVISFGVAPAILMLRTVVTALRQEVISYPPDSLLLERLVWCAAAAYAGCAALRLARFNVENEPDESAHMSFEGLPSPGAASVVTALVLLFVRLSNISEGWRSSPWLLTIVGVILPIVTLLTAALMVSRLPYPHVVNRYIRSRKPFIHLVKLLVVALAASVELFLTAAVVTMLFAFSAPAAALWKKLRSRNTADQG